MLQSISAPSSFHFTFLVYFSMYFFSLLFHGFGILCRYVRLSIQKCRKQRHTSLMASLFICGLTLFYITLRIFPQCFILISRSTVSHRKFSHLLFISLFALLLHPSPPLIHSLSHISFEKLSIEKFIINSKNQHTFTHTFNLAVSVQPNTYFDQSLLLCRLNTVSNFLSIFSVHFGVSMIAEKKKFCRFFFCLVRDTQKNITQKNEIIRNVYVDIFSTFIKNGRLERRWCSD